MSDDPVYLVPDGIEPIVGYRSWVVVPSPGYEYRLRAVSMQHSPCWEPRVASVAQCNGKKHGRQTWQLKRISELPPPEPTYTTMMTLNPWHAPAATAQMMKVTTGTTMNVSYNVMTPPSPNLPTATPPPGFTWVAGEIVFDQDSPVESCACGIYAGADWSPVPPADVRGEVYLWGKVIKGDRGYRAQYAYPKRFTDWNPTITDKVKMLSEIYQVPYAPDGAYSAPDDLEQVTQLVQRWQTEIQANQKRLNRIKRWLP